MVSGKKIIIVNGEKSSATILYRSNAAERCLKKLGLGVDIHHVDNLDNICLKDATACLFVRTPLTQLVGTFIERLKSLDMIVLADFDDLIFRPDLLHLFDGFKYLSKDEQDLFLKRTFQFKEMVKIADCVIVTTIPLATEAARYNKRIILIRNYPLEVTKRFSLLSNLTKRNSDKFVIGYYSGTLTHQTDFRQCAPVLARLMKERSEIELRIVGKMDISEFIEFEGLDSRITKIPLLPYEDMLTDLTGCDLNVAPLEPNNIFCECKSELKYFDAALMRVPTIASPTRPFADAIRHGINGYLASSPNDWSDCLKTILKDKRAVKYVGQSARRYALSFFGELAQLNDYRDLMKLAVK